MTGRQKLPLVLTALLLGNLLSAGDSSKTRGSITIEDVGDGATSLAFSSDSNVLAVANGKDGTIAFLEILSGKRIKRSFTVPAQGQNDKTWAPTRVAFSSNDEFLAGVRYGLNCPLVIWDWKNEIEFARVNGLNLVSAFSFGPDNELVAIVDSKWIVVFNIQKKVVVHRIPHKDGGLASWLAFSHDGKKLAVTGAGFPRLRIYNIASGQEERALSSDVAGGWFLAVHWTKDNKSLVVVGPENAISYWDVALQRKYRQYGSIKGLSPIPELRLAVSPDEKLIAVSSDDKTMHVWDTSTFSQTTFLNHWLPSFSSNGRWIACVVLEGRNPAIRVWNCELFRKSLR